MPVGSRFCVNLRVEVSFLKFRLEVTPSLSLSPSLCVFLIVYCCRVLSTEEADKEEGKKPPEEVSTIPTGWKPKDVGQEHLAATYEEAVWVPFTATSSGGSSCEARTTWHSACLVSLIPSNF